MRPKKNEYQCLIKDAAVWHIQHPQASKAGWGQGLLTQSPGNFYSARSAQTDHCHT
jgi:hypothetical protein